MGVEGPDGANVHLFQIFAWLKKPRHLLNLVNECFGARRLIFTLRSRQPPSAQNKNLLWLNNPNLYHLVKNKALPQFAPRSLSKVRYVQKSSRKWICPFWQTGPGLFSIAFNLLLKFFPEQCLIKIIYTTIDKENVSCNSLKIKHFPLHHILRFNQGLHRKTGKIPPFSP